MVDKQDLEAIREAEGDLAYVMELPLTKQRMLLRRYTPPDVSAHLDDIESVTVADQIDDWMHEVVRVAEVYGPHYVHMVEQEIKNAEFALSTGKLIREPNTDNYLTQFVWAAYFSLIDEELKVRDPDEFTIHADWGISSEINDISQTELFQEVMSSPGARKFMAVSARILSKLQIDPRATMAFGKPGSWFNNATYFDGKTPPHVNMDAQHALTAGFFHTLAIMMHELFHSQNTLQFPHTQMLLREKMIELDERLRSGEIDDPEEEVYLYTELLLTRYEYDLRGRFHNAGEDNAANEFTRKMTQRLIAGYEQDYAASMNHTEVTITGVGHQYYDRFGWQSPVGKTREQLQVIEAMQKKAREQGADVYGPQNLNDYYENILDDTDLPENPVEPDKLTDDPQFKYHAARFSNVCHAINMTFFNRNGLFPDTEKGWFIAGVNPEWIHDASGQSVWQQDFELLREMADEIAFLQPNHFDYLHKDGAPHLRQVAQGLCLQRNGVIEELWDHFAEPHVRVMVNKARKQAKKNAEQHMSLRDAMQALMDELGIDAGEGGDIIVDGQPMPGVGIPDERPGQGRDGGDKGNMPTVGDIAAGQEDEADKGKKKSRSNSPGRGKGNPDWNKHTNITELDTLITEFGGEIDEFADHYQMLQNKQFVTTQEPSKQHQLLPEGGDFRAFDWRRDQRLREMMGVGADVKIEDVARFEAEQMIQVPALMSVIDLVDGSGSMNGARLDRCRQFGLIRHEALQSPGINAHHYMNMWGSEPVTVISPDMDDDDVLTNIAAINNGLNSGTQLAPTFEHISQLMHDQPFQPNMPIGYSLVTIFSDGDAENPAVIKPIIQRFLEANPYTVIDAVILKSGGQKTNLEKALEDIDPPRPWQDIGIIRRPATDAQGLQEAMTERLFKRFLELPPIHAMPFVVKQAFLQNGMSEVGR